MNSLRLSPRVVQEWRGEVFRDPDHLGRQIRIMPGYGKGARPDEITSVPYPVVSQNGRVTKAPLAGNPVLQ
jgi:hypothetical protein